MGLAGGLEFLFGLSDAAGDYRCWWARTGAEEQAAFEAVVGAIMARWAEHPDLHVYHYAPYEPAALRRLMGRHARCEDAIDRMLRAGLFVDLCAVVKQSLRASVESYSLKQVEPLYGFERAGELRTAGAAVRAVQLALGRGAGDAIGAELRASVEAYNRDDCESLRHLQRWLEELRAGLEAAGTPVPRPAAGDPEPSEALSAERARVRAVAEQLVDGVPEAPEERSPEQAARWLLAQLLEYHRREEKVAYWERFRLAELSVDDAQEERAAIGGLAFEATVGASKRGLPHQRYRFPPQEVDIDPGDDLTAPDGNKLGTVQAIDRHAGWIDIQKTGEKSDEHPPVVFHHEVFPSAQQAAALLRLGEHVLEHGVERAAAGPHAAALDLLHRAAPRIAGGVALAPRAGESVADLARRIAPLLDRTALAIQGPPGSGKTYTGSRMILELVKAGKRVGVTAVSHKVIRKLLDGVVEAAAEEGVKVDCAHKVKEKSEEPGPIREETGNARPRRLLADGDVDVLGGTAYLWSREDMAGAVDVLVVDEAGQMSLANVLAVAQASGSLVLLGDPRQLEQPQQGAHPEGADISALEHLLGDRLTMPEGRGLFLSQTRRLAPALCRYTSELFYEGRLTPCPGLEHQVIAGPTPLAGAGLLHIPVSHAGNTSSAPEEVEVVCRAVDSLLAPGVSWVNDRAKPASLQPADILVVAPYNAQVDLLAERLASRGVPVGTVDRFQGQEAPVVLYSMATSTPEDAPRGMEFLYSLHRLNVATSRARCAVVLVASPRLFEPDCRTPRQMQLASAYCRYLELARTVELPGRRAGPA